MKRLYKTLPCLLVCMALFACSASPAVPTAIPQPQPTPTQAAVNPLPTKTATESPSSSPTPIPTPEPKPSIVQISVGNKACYILRSDGSLWAWGDNEFGQIGDGTRDTCKQFKKILDGVKRITSNQMAIKNDDTLWTWGKESLSPNQVMAGVRDANTGYVVKTDGTLWAYGSRKYMLGDGVPGDLFKKNPGYVPIESAKKIMDNVQSIPVAGETSMAIKNDGSLWIWGDTMLTGKSWESRPVQILTRVESAAYMAGYDGAKANVICLQNSGKVYQWGDYLDRYPQEEAPVSKFTNIDIPFEDKAACISAYGFSAFAVLRDGTLLTWGISAGTEPTGWEGTTPGNSYTTITKDARSVAAGNETLLVLKNDGSIWAAGKACYNENNPNLVSQSKKLAPAFYEMWGPPAPVPSPTAASQPGSTEKSGISRHMDSWEFNGFEFSNYASISVFTGVLNKRTVVLFAYPGSWDQSYGYRDVWCEAFTGLPVFSYTDKKEWLKSFQGTFFLPGKWKLTQYDTLGDYFENLGADIDWSGVKNGKQLREIYEKYVPSSQRYIVPENLRQINKDAYIETFRVNGEEKLLFVYRNVFETFNSSNAKVKYITCWDLINGCSYCDPRCVILYSGDNNTEGGSWRNFYNKFGIMPSTSGKRIPFSEYFKKVKYKKVMTRDELISFYKKNIPAEKQLLLPDGAGFLLTARDLADLLNYTNGVKPGSYQEVPKWTGYADVCKALKQEIADKFQYPVDSLDTACLWSDEQITGALQYIEYDSQKGLFIVNIG